MSRTNLPYECGRVIARAIGAGVVIDAGNVIDLLADNLPGEELGELRAALAVSQYAGRWPRAEVVRDARVVAGMSPEDAAEMDRRGF